MDVADTVLNWVLRGVFFLFGAGAAIALLRWLRASFAERREKWAARIAIGMIVLAGVYAWGHGRLLMNAEEIEEGREKYARFGDPRLAEQNRGELRGWILDCTGEDANALARYGVRDGEVARVYPLGQGGANLIGGGQDSIVRDFTVERVFASRLRQPMSFGEELIPGAGGSVSPGGKCRPMLPQAAGITLGAERALTRRAPSEKHSLPPVVFYDSF